MLFDLHPKESPQFLYGRDDDLSNLLNHIRNRRWVAVLGIRMIGKTSLVKAARHDLHEAGIMSLYINVRGINSVVALLKAIVHCINQSSGLYEKVRNSLKQVSGLTVGPMGISLSSTDRPVSTTWNILSVLGDRCEDLVIILDEMQELKAVSGHLANILANVFATYPNITFCFTGSYLGLVRSLLEPKSHSPLYGRSPARINIGPFNRTTSREFLSAGFKEANVSVEIESIEEVIDRFDGIPGWLAFYGNGVTVSGLAHEEALAYTEKESFKIQQAVLKHYLADKDKKRHTIALRVVATQASWTEIRQALKAHAGRPLNDATLKNILDAMSSSLLIEKVNSTYRVADPTLRRFLLSGLH